MKTVLLFILFLPCTLFAQLGINIIEGPLVQMPCDSSCIMLNANFPKTKKTNSYTSSSIAYSPNSISGNTIALNDDKFSNAIPIGFNFCFYEHTYNQCYISDNGVLTFEASYAGGNCFNNTQQSLPYFNSTCPDNAIFFLFMDIAPQLGGSIQYATIGSAPNRKFVAQYSNMKIFGTTCSNTVSTFQVVLYELSNMIEVHIANKVVCDANPGNQKNYATIGVQNIGATASYTIPGKNASVFTASNEAYRIEPNGPNDYTVTWKNANNTTIATNVDSLHFCPPAYPYHKVTATVVYGCPNNSSYSDTVAFKKNQPNISATTVLPLCNSAIGVITVNSTSLNGPFTYAINNGNFGSTNSFTNLAAGTYTCKVKDANGCVKDTVISLQPINNLALVIDSVHHPGCTDTTGYAWVHAINGLPTYSYTWSNGQTGPVLGPVPQGSYMVTVTDANGCSATTIVFLLPQNLPVLNATLVKPVCGNSNGSIAVSVSGGTPSYTYLWSTNASTSQINNLSSGTYTLTVTDAGGCVISAGYTLQDTLYVLNINSIVQPSCGLNNGSITTYAYNSIGPYTYTWQPGNLNTASINNLAPGSYTCTIAASNGCTKTTVVTMFPSVGMDNVLSYANANCDSSNGKIYLLNVLNYSNNYSILWSTMDTTSSISNLAPGVYWVKTTDAVGCYTIDTLVILNDGRPQLNIVSYTPPLCFGDSTGSAVFSGSNGVAPYKYSLDSINFSSVATMNNIPGGTYYVYITDANSCVNDTLITFPQPSKIQVDYSGDTLVCFYDSNASVTLQASDGFAPYVYAFDDSVFSTQTLYTNNSIGWHTVLVKDAHNCIIQDSVWVAGPETPLYVSITKEDINCRQNNTGSYHVDISGGWQPYVYQWSGNLQNLDGDSLHAVHELLVVTDNKGCEVQASLNINQLYCCNLYFPNVFTPNHDGLNDYFKPITVDNITSYVFKVYNRFGEMLYVSKNLQDPGWDGADADVGTYFFFAQYTCPSEKEKQIIKGDVTLLR